jgi:hypothetical protein
MKETHRSRRSRRTHQSITNDNDDESDLEYQTFQRKSIVRSNKNANRIPTTLFDTIQEKQHSSSDQSSLFLYSINSIQKPLAISDDLTPLTITTTNTTPLTTLTYSNTKHTERVKIDLSGTDTLDSSPINSDHDQSLSLDRTISSPNLNNKMKNTKDLTQAYDTDTSMKSVVFSKNKSLEQELSYQKHTSDFTIPSVGNRDCMTIASPSIIEDVSLSTNVNTCQRSPVRWNFQNTTSRFKLLIGCSSLSLIVGLVILVIIL